MRLSAIFGLIAVAGHASLNAQQLDDVRSRVRVLAQTGHLTEAESAARSAGSANASILGEVLVLRGKLAAADSALRVAIVFDARGKRTSEATLAELAYRRGDRADALSRAAALTRDYESGSSGWSAEDRTAAGRAYVLQSSRNAQSVRKALAAFDAAVAVDKTNIDARLLTGNLFLEKYNAPDAQASFDAVIKIAPKNPRALLGLARVAQFRGKREAQSYLHASLEEDPELTDAHVILARSHLHAEAYDSAKLEVGRALAVDSSSMAAWSVLGALAWTTGDSAQFRTAQAGAYRLNPHPSDFFAELADAAERQHRYGDGVRLAQQALSLDSTSLRALGLVATNQMRAGNIDAAKATLDRAFAIDPFNLWHKNTLDLIDELSKFKTLDKGRFRIVAPAQEAEILSTYLQPLLEEEYDSLARRYNYRPAPPVRMEIYSRHADFSVRTVGLTGLGALGVSFGPVLAIDAPSSRDRGEFNWGSVAWHEVAHTFTLGLSNSRVPRWMTEGLSVLEERHARPEWGAKASVEFLAAYKAGRLRPVSSLNDGFVRPKYEQETIFSYYDASLVCEMIEAEHGTAGLVQMLQAYADGASTPQVFQRVLGMTPDAVDKHFDTWIRTKFAVALAAIEPNDENQELSGAFVTAMRAGADAFGRKDFDAARTQFLRAEALFPDYGGSNNPGFPLALIAKERGDLREALLQVQRVTTRAESAWDANLLEASLREQLGDSAGARIPLERLIWISPYDVSVHSRLAELATRRKDFASAVRERRAVVSLAPTDMLDARYQLAQALADAGNAAEARTLLLTVLEQAPSFEKAQQLLLDLRNRAKAAGA